MKNKRGIAENEAVVEGPKVDGSLPLYEKPRAVHSVTHRDIGIRVGQNDYGFAEQAPMVQVTVDEFERAALDYPIVFFGADRQPYAVTALELGRNLFVADGAYRDGAYIPAYLRRYPFVFARDEGSDALILCLDQNSNQVSATGDAQTEALFDGDAPTALTRQALAFCEGYEGASNRTKVFVALMDELGLLEGKQAHYTPVGSSRADASARISDDRPRSTRCARRGGFPKAAGCTVRGGGVCCRRIAGAVGRTCADQSLDFDAAIPGPGLYWPRLRYLFQ